MLRLATSALRAALTIAVQPEIPLFDPGTMAYGSRHPSTQSQKVRIIRHNLVTKMLPQMLILRQPSPNKCRLLGHGRNFQRNIGFNVRAQQFLTASSDSLIASFQESALITRRAGFHEIARGYLLIAP